MPTFQTSPHFKWVYPDEAVRINARGVQPLVAVPLPNQYRDIDQGAPKYNWAEQARNDALQRLHSNKVKEEGMLFLRNTTDRTQAHFLPTHPSQCRINGTFDSDNGMQGGTGLITKEGREWAKKRLAQRVNELNAISSGDYSQGKPSHIEIKPSLDALDAILAQFQDEISAGVFPNSIVDSAQKLIAELFKVGATIDVQSLANYVNIVAGIQLEVDRASNTAGGIFTFKEEKRTIQRALISSLNRFQRLAEEIARVIYESPENRALVMQDIRKRFLGKQNITIPSTKFNPVTGAPVLPTNVYVPGPIVPGKRLEVLPPSSVVGMGRPFR